MSGDFECFVTIGDKKHSIYLDKDIDNVIFSDVYKQLTQLDVEPDVSFDNYIFEVFDFEDNCFQRLTSVEMPIKYLSRIRVLPKNSNTDKEFEFNQKTKGFKQKFNQNLFNSELIDENQVNEEFFNPEAEEDMTIPVPKAKRPIAPTRYFNDYKKQMYSPPTLSEEREMDEDFYNELYLNTNKRMKFRGYGDYGADGSEYERYLGPPVSTPPPYARRSDMFNPIAGPSFADPYAEPPQQPYYARRDDYNNPFMSAPQQSYANFSPYYRPNGYQMNYRPEFQFQNMGFSPRSDFSPRMGFRPKNAQNFRPNSPQNRNDFQLKKRLKNNGFTIETINGFEYFFCEFCEIKFKHIDKALSHINTGDHMSKTNEKSVPPLDKLLLVKTHSPNDMKTMILRRQQLRKISKSDKQKLVRHGIRLKDATGPQAFICIRCCSSLSSLTGCLEHYDKFLEINKSINYPKDYHLLTEDNSLPKVELRYRRILNALELLIEENRTEEQLSQLIQLRDEGIVYKESIDGSNRKYFSCLVCDKRFDTNAEALTHSKSDEHLKNRSPKRYKGLDRAILMDSGRANQIEIVLARKQELEKIKYFTKEMNIEHGIRLKEGIGPEAYFCTKCDQWFDSSNVVKTHIDEYDKRLISESTEESLIDSAKRQMELLSKQSEENLKKKDKEEEEKEVIELKDQEDKYDEEEEGDEQMDTTAEEEDNNTLKNEVYEQRFASEGIKTIPAEEEDKDERYYDIFCDIYFDSKEQAVHHLDRSFHKRIITGEFLNSIDKAFCVSSNNISDPEVALSRFQILDKLADEVKQKFTEEGIRLRDGVGPEAFWCALCSENILSPNVESSSYSFINHMNYNPKHVELLIAQNK